MKSCPKCNRTFPDEGQKFCTFDGGLLIAPQTFDPNATMRSTSADLSAMAEKATSRELPDPNATIVESSSYASTVALPRNTAPTGGRGSTPNTADLNPAATIVDQAPPLPPLSSSQDQTVALPNIDPPTTPPPPQATAPVVPATPDPNATVAIPTPVAPQAAAATATAAKTSAATQKKSKLPLIIGAIVVVLLLGGGALAGVFFFVIKPKLDERNAANTNQEQPIAQNTNTASTPEPSATATPIPEDTYTPPLGTVAFENSNDRLDGKLAEHFFDFNFYYPESWQKDPKAGVPGASSFVRVERRLPPNYTQENFSVGWYTSTGTYDGDLPNYPKRVEEVSSVLAKSIPEYKKVSEGPTTVNKMSAYEFRWVGFSKDDEGRDRKLWGRVIFLPTEKAGDTTGATLTMLSTDLAPELSSVEDLGEKGEAPVILESFRFGKLKK